MASVNVGQLSARFGLDPSEFLEKLKGVSGATSLMSSQMAREMRQSSRESAESLRLIDESLGIHLSRPLVRILTQEFPSFAKGLQTVLGGAVFGALATVGVEAFDKVERSIEKAQKAQEELKKSSENVTAVFRTEIDSYKEKDAAVVAATGKISELITAQERETRAMLEAAGPWNHLLAAIGNFAHTTFSFQSTLNIEATSKQLGEFQQKLDAVPRTLEGARLAQKMLTDEIERSTKAYTDMQAAAVAAAAAPPATVPLVVGRGVIQYSGAKPGPTSDQLEAAKLYKEQLQQIADLWKTIFSAERGKEVGAQMEEARRAFAALQQDIAGGMNKLMPETDPIKKLRSDINGLEMQAENAFRKLKESAASALELRAAESRLAEYKKHLEDVFNVARRNADVAKATAELPTKIAAGPAPVISAEGAMPSLGSGGLLASKLDAFSKDQVAQLAMAAHAYELALSPQERYRLGVQQLAILRKEDLISEQAQAAGMAELDAQLVKAASSTEKLQQEMMKLLQRSSDAGAGVRAFVLQLQISNMEEAKFAFDALTAASKSGESAAADSLIKSIEVHKDQHQQLIHQLRQMWESYFAGLAKMAIEHGMQKLLAPIGQGMAGLLNPAQRKQGDLQKQFDEGPGRMFAGLVPKVGKDVALDANSAALHALTAALLQKGGGAGFLSLISGAGGGSSGGGGSWGGGGAAGAEAGGDVPFFAEGGDVSPGGSFISGEAGAERVDLERGGAHVTPLGGTTGGGDTHIHYDMRGAVVTDDLMRKADAAAMMEHTRAAAVGAAVSVSRESTLRARPQR